MRVMRKAIDEMNANNSTNMPESKEKKAHYSLAHANNSTKKSEKQKKGALQFGAFLEPVVNFAQTILTETMAQANNSTKMPEKQRRQRSNRYRVEYRVWIYT